MGNTLDAFYIPELEKAFYQNEDDRVRGMIVWAIGRIGGSAAPVILQKMGAGSSAAVREEIALAINK